MPAPATPDEFLDLVRKSGLADEKRLDAWLQEARIETASSKPKTLAEALVRDGLLSSFQADAILLGKWNGFTIGPQYKVLGRIGSGNMGSVYLCEDTDSKLARAVKVLPTAAANDVSRRQRFCREAQCQAAVLHSNIAAASCVGEHEGLAYIGMEYVYGSSLQQIVEAKGRLDVHRSAHYIRQAALGLHAVHMQGIVHRDIEPANILVDYTGTVKIIDFGLARSADGQSLPANQNHLVAEGMLGPEYLAPEWALTSAADQRSDIYSLGAVFYFCLAGRPPVPEGTVHQQLRWLRTSCPEPIRSLRADIPEAMAAILERMTAKEPSARYPHMQVVADALAPWTKRPIPPPAEHELPRWSPAAMEAIRRSLNLKHR